MAKRNAVVVTHTRLRQTGTVVAEAVSQLRVAGFEVTIIDNTEAPDFGVQPPCVSDDTEIVVVLGGDGTILRAAELVHCTQVPILGVNMGHVGFLAEFESFQIDEAIRRVATHDYSIDERMIAHVDVWLPGATKPIEDWALNDITLERADRGKMVELSIRVDDVEMNAHRFHRLRLLRGRSGHVAERQGPAVDSVGRARPVRQAADHRLRLDLHHRYSGRIHVRRLDLLRWPPPARPAAGYARHGARIARYLAPRPTLRRAVHQPSGLQVRSARGRLARARAQTFPAAAYAAGVAVAVAGDAGVAGTDPDKPGERDGKAGA